MIFKLSIFFLLGIICTIPLTWRQLIKMVLVLVVLEGAIRKWGIPGASQFVYFAKDLVLLLGYFKYLNVPRGSSRSFAIDRTLRGIILANIILVGFQVCNPLNGSPVLGLFGARNYFLYLPLMFLVRDLFRSRQELIDFLQWYMLLVLPVGMLAVKQHLSPANSVWNVYARSEEGGTAMIGQSVRVTGTFSYIAGYASYLQTMAALVIPMLVLQLPPIWRWLVRIVFAVILSSILLTGSRGPIVVMSLFLILYFILNRAFREHRLYTKFIVPGALFALAVATWLAPQLIQVSKRAGGSSDVLPRITETLLSPFSSFTYTGIIGFGAGSCYQAANTIRNVLALPYGQPIPIFLESEPQRVMFELGPIGFLFWYGLRITLIMRLWHVYTILRKPVYRELALTAFLIHVTGLPGQMVFQITFMVYYWFLAGFIFLLPRLEHREWINDQVENELNEEPVPHEENLKWDDVAT